MIEERRPRILFVSSSSDWTGPSKSLLLLLRHLRAEFDVGVLLPGNGAFVGVLEQEEIPVSTLPSLTKRYLPAVANLVRRNGYDALYGNNARGSSRIAFAAAFLNRKRFLCHIRGMEEDKTWLQLGYLRLADAVIAVSRACADSVRRFVRPTRLHVVYNGVSMNSQSTFAPASRAEIRAELGMPDQGTLFLSVSHLCPRKGQEHAIAALAALRDKLPSAHLCLLGRLDRDRRYVDRLQGLVREHRLEDRVHFMGFREDVNRFLCASDVLVHTAVADPHPRSVIEAMAAGLPVVAFDVDGVAETVIDGQTGLLLPPGDSQRLARGLRRVAEDAELCKRYGVAGRDRVREFFTATATGEQVSGILRQVLGSHKYG